jgi:hypothetical protein
VPLSFSLPEEKSASGRQPHRCRYGGGSKILKANYKSQTTNNKQNKMTEIQNFKSQMTNNK